MSEGIRLIEAERERQISEEGWTPEHDDEHTDGSLAMAAACFAAPERVFLEDRQSANSVFFSDPWPWDDKWDKRYTYEGGNRLPEPKTYSAERRLDLLVKAGALIAAEIDRLHRMAEG